MWPPSWNCLVVRIFNPMEESVILLLAFVESMASGAIDFIEPFFFV